MFIRCNMYKIIKNEDLDHEINMITNTNHLLPYDVSVIDDELSIIVLYPLWPNSLNHKYIQNTYNVLTDEIIREYLWN